jgi:hypothetical protein
MRPVRTRAAVQMRPLFYSKRRVPTHNKKEKDNPEDRNDPAGVTRGSGIIQLCNREDNRRCCEDCCCIEPGNRECPGKDEIVDEKSYVVVL